MAEHARKHASTLRYIKTESPKFNKRIRLGPDQTPTRLIKQSVPGQEIADLKKILNSDYNNVADLWLQDNIIEGQKGHGSELFFASRSMNTK